MREAKGLRVPATIRILFAIFGVYSVLAMPVVPSSELPYIIATYVFFIIANTYFLLLLRGVRRLKLVGRTGFAIDVLAITSYFTSNSHIADQAGHSPAVVAKDLFIVVCIEKRRMTSLLPMC